MMKWQKSPPELKKTFDAAFPMFGGLWQAEIVLRLGDADRERITAERGAEPFEPMARPMKGYVTVPQAIVTDAGQLRDWLKRAFDYSAALAAKEKKPPSAKRTTKKSSR